MFARILRQAAAAAAAATPVTAQTSVVAPTPKYNRLMAAFHWTMAIGAGTCIGTVLYAQSLPKDTAEGKEMRGQLMSVHKSIGLAMAVLMVPRLAVRMFSKIPAHPTHSAGTMLSELQARAGEATHAMLLASLGVLTASGLGFAYFFGGGIKFFGLDAWPGAQGEAKNPAFAKQLFWVHSVTGQFLEYLVPVHIAGVFAGYAQGTNMLARMSPFAKNAKQAAAVVSK